MTFFDNLSACSHLKASYFYRLGLKKLTYNKLATLLNIPDDPLLTEEEWISKGPETRLVLGGTRCVRKLKNDILYLGFRGSADSRDWEDNSHFDLVGLEGEDSLERVHRGFKERAAKILDDDLVSQIPQDLPKRIVVTGHSLGAAISQLIYMQLQSKIKEERELEVLECEVLNISFASPMVGNHDLRDKLMKTGVAEGMFHFVLQEDIVPAAAFYRHSFQKLPAPIIMKKEDVYKSLYHLLYKFYKMFRKGNEAIRMFPPELRDRH